MTGILSAFVAAFLFPEANPGPSPLPADPPIGGFVWTVVIPAILFLGSLLGTYLLYRRFSTEEGE